MQNDRGAGLQQRVLHERADLGAGQHLGNRGVPRCGGVMIRAWLDLAHASDVDVGRAVQEAEALGLERSAVRPCPGHCRRRRHDPQLRRVCRLVIDGDVALCVL